MIDVSGSCSEDAIHVTRNSEVLPLFATFRRARAASTPIVDSELERRYPAAPAGLAGPFTAAGAPVGPGRSAPSVFVCDFWVFATGCVSSYGTAQCSSRRFFPPSSVLRIAV